MCIRDRGTFRVGMECNYAPYNWTQAEPSEYAVAIEGGGGYADGYDVQIAFDVNHLHFFEKETETTPVSYTHLDVYKRQAIRWPRCRR